MRERDEIRLLEYLDGRLPVAERAEVEARIARDPALRRLVAEHRVVWDALGELGAPDASDETPDRRFRERVCELIGAEAEQPRAAPFASPRVLRSAGLLAASAVLAIALFQWFAPLTGRSELALTAEERLVIQNLELLENYDLLQRYGPQLDLAVELEVMRAFEGEGEVADPSTEDIDAAPATAEEGR